MVALTTGTDTTIMAAGANLATTLATVLCFYIYTNIIQNEKRNCF